ncbi:hypothetical protein DYH09_27200 [bacterium CPR1]|nr:hypothetical protein [bacterium CPR1]
MKPQDVAGVLVGEVHPVNVSKTRQELSRLWDEAIIKFGTDRMRLSTLNLVTVLTGPDELPCIGEDLRSLCSHYPARVFAVVLDPEGTGEMAGWYSVNCNGSQVYQEQLTLHLPGETDRQLPSLLAPLYHGDQPVFLWWRGRPGFAHPLWERLADQADRIVVDTSHGAGLLADLNRQVRDPYHQELAFSDLEWTRQARWRNLLAGLYDRPGASEHLKKVSRLEIGFVPGPERAESAPLYMAGWLASRLGWSVEKSLGEGHAVFRSGAGRAIEFVLQNEEGPDVLKNRLLYVRLDATPVGCCYGVYRKPENPRVYVSQVSGEETVHSTAMPSGFVAASTLLRSPPRSAENDVFMPFAEQLNLIAAELEVFTRQSLFERSLAAAAEILGAAVTR